MNARTATRLAWGLWIVALLLSAAAVGLLLSSGAAIFDALVLTLATLGYATVGRLIASRHQQNPIGWLFLTSGVLFAVAALTDAYAVRGILIAPGSLRLVPFFVWIQNWIFVPAMAAIPLAVLLFPTGVLPSRRWKPVAWVIVAGAVLAVVGLIIRPGQAGGTVTVENPTGISGLGPLGGALGMIAGVMVLGGTVAAVVSVILRFRRAVGQERQQLRWLVYTSAAAIVVFVLTWLAEPLLGSTAFSETGVAVGNVLFVLFFVIATIGIPAATGVAILRYRLYSLDVVIRRTVVFGILAAFITAAYVLVVIAVPSFLFGVSGAASLVPFAAAAALAIAFQPVRRWASRVANRLVYGKRATPYEVLVEFAEHAGSYSIDEVLPRMAEIIAKGTGATRAAVWLHVEGALRREAAYPSESSGGWPHSIATDGSDVPEIPDTDAVVPVRHRGEVLGALTVAMPAAEPLTPAHQELLSNVASQAGLVLRNVRLIEELRASRQRIVAAQDEERRRIERNIHDGAQQQLVALAVNLKLARTVAAKDLNKAREILERLQSDTQTALEDLRDLARGVYPPLLADKGLAAALEAQARKSATPVDVESDGVGRFGQEGEAAVYFCVLEALQNASKYASASRIAVRLRRENGEVLFEVEDDGAGFDPDTTSRGAGLRNMTDRVEALGGLLEVSSEVGRGTTIAGRIPAQAPPASDQA
jgi:signal transduction histidine kinase